MMDHDSPNVDPTPETPAGASPAAAPASAAPTGFARLVQLCCTAVILVLVIGLPFWWLATVSGPYLWMARLELRLNGSYGSKLFFIPVFMVWMLFWFILHATSAKWPGPLRHLRTAYDMDAAIWLGPLLLAIAGVGLCLYGFLPREPKQFSINEIYSADARPPHYVTLTDVLVDPLAPILSETKNNSEYAYIPAVGVAAAGQPVKVFIRESATGLDRLGEGIAANQSVTGIVQRSGLNGLHRDWFSQQGLPVAEMSYVIDAGSDPTFDGIMGIVAIVAGAVMGMGNRPKQVKAAAS